MNPYLTLVIPVYNEQEVIPALISRVGKALKATGRTFEVIIVNDGSTDATAALLEEGRKQNPWLRVLALDRNWGQSAAFDAGFKAAGGQVIATIDGDLQNDPEEIARLLPMLDGCDMVTGWRRDRHDTKWRMIQSRIANGIRNWISQETIHDSACSLKLYKRHCLQGLQMYTGMHRFLPTLIRMRGLSVIETPVKHSPRFAGRPKYTMRNRALRAFIDLLAVRWMKNRQLRYRVTEVAATGS